MASHKKIETNIEQDVTRVFKYKDFGGVTVLSCMGCDKELVHIMKVSNVDKMQKFQADCPFCDDKSWMREVTGNTMIGPVDGVTVIENFETVGELTNIIIVKA